MSSVSKRKNITTQTSADTNTNTQNSVDEGTYSSDGRVFKDLKHIQFDELASFVNGIRIMALKNADDVVPEHRELFKLRISNPVWVIIMYSE